MDDSDRLSGKEILEVLDTSRNPFVLAKIRNKALSYINSTSVNLPESKCRACKDYVSNFNTYKRMSDQLRDLSVWVDEINAYLDQDVAS